MSFSNDRENELEQYGAAVGIAISNGLQEEAIDLAFTRGGGISIWENVQGASLPVTADLDANAVGGADATLTFTHDQSHALRAMTIAADGNQGTVTLDRQGNELRSVSVDKDGDGNVDTTLRYERSGGLKFIHVDENNDGKTDAILSPAIADKAADTRVQGFNVDLGADGNIDGFAEFVRSQNGQINSIRFHKR